MPLLAVSVLLLHGVASQGHRRLLSPQSTDKPVRARAKPADFVGTYEVWVCRGRPCRGDNDTAALSQLMVDLEPAPIRVDTFGLSTPFRRPGSSFDAGVGNGCFKVVRTFSKETYAGLGDVGLFGWTTDSSGEVVTFSPAKSPDAGYVIQAELRDGLLTGRGHSWGAGVAAVDWPPDSIIGIRTGPPNAGKCLE